METRQRAVGHSLRRGLVRYGACALAIVLPSHASAQSHDGWPLHGHDLGIGMSQQNLDQFHGRVTGRTENGNACHESPNPSQGTGGQQLTQNMESPQYIRLDRLFLGG